MTNVRGRRLLPSRTAKTHRPVGNKRLFSGSGLQHPAILSVLLCVAAT